MHTPWGQSHTTDRYAPGFVSVDTSSHGGFRLSETFADAVGLSEAARNAATYHWKGHAYWYEEDCDWNVLTIELPQYADKMFAYMDDSARKDPRAYSLLVLSQYKPEYLIARGITPDATRYGRYLRGQQNDQMRAARHPDLIVAGSGDWKTGIPGVYEAITADGKTHLVHGDSYTAAMQSDSYPLFLLSDCTLYTPNGQD